MTTDIAALQIDVNSDDAKRARTELDKLAAAAGKAQRAEDQLTAAGGNAEAMAGKLATSFRASAIAAASVVAATVGAAFAVDRLIKAVGEYQDIAERTGGSAKGWASIRTAADVAQMSVSSVAEATNRLTLALSKVDEEGDPAARALKAIGLSAAELRNQSPDEQLRTIARALAQFEDNASKAAIAQTLYGRGGAALLPVLKELGKEQQRITYLTQDQIKAADEYGDEQAKLRSQLTQMVQVAALQAAPAMIALLDATRDAADEVLGLSNASDTLGANGGISDFATGATQVFGAVISAGQVVSRVIEGVGNGIAGLAAAASAVASGEFRQAKVILGEMVRAGKDIADREFFITKLNRRLGVKGTAQGDDSHEGGTRPLDFRADPKQSKKTKTVNDGRLDALKIEASTEQSIFQSRNAALQTYHSAALISDEAFYAGREATRAEYIATLQRQFAQEQAVLQQQLATAPADKRADAQKALNQATADYNEKLRGIAESGGAEELERIARARAFVTEATDMSRKAVIAELANMAAGNKTLRDEIALLGATEEAKAAVEKARIRSIRTLKEEQLAQMEAANAGGLLAEAQLRQLELEIRLLKEREDLIGQRQRKVADVKVRDDNIKASEELGKQTHQDVKDALARAFQDSKDPVGAFADALGNTIYTRLTSRITDALATAAVGKDGSGGMFGDLFAGVFGGGDKGQGVGNTDAGAAITKLGETTSLATAKLAEEAATTAASTALTALGTTSVPSASFAVDTFTQALGIAQGALYDLAGSSSASGAEGLITSLFSSFTGGGPGAPGGGVDYSLPSDGVRFGGGRASGGSTQRKAMYQVAEGDKPELYREDGRTYLMTGDRGGMVTPARSFDGGGQAAPAQPIINKINIINNAQARVKTQQRQDGGLDVLIEQIEGALGQRVDNGVGLARNVGGRFGLNSGAGLVR